MSGNKITAWRLIYEDGSVNSHKFYDVYYLEVGITGSAYVITRWGRLGAKGQTQSMGGNRQVALGKAREKANKGYTYQVTDLTWTTSLGPNDNADAVGKEAEAEILRHLAKTTTGNADTKFSTLAATARDLVQHAHSTKADVGLMLDRWNGLQDEWAKVKIEYEHTFAAIQEAEAAITQRVMGG